MFLNHDIMSAFGNNFYVSHFCQRAKSKKLFTQHQKIEIYTDEIVKAKMHD